jgi:parallel beta-helix repeat protein
MDTIAHSTMGDLVVGNYDLSPSVLAFVPASARYGVFGAAKWYPVPVAASMLCSGGCSQVTGNTVYQNRVLGIYIRTGSTGISSYLATVPGR